MSVNRLIPLLVLMFSIEIQPVIGGGWPMPKGGYFLKLSEWWMVSDKHFDSEGHIQSNLLEYGYYATTLSGEYGLGKRTTVSIQFPVINYAYSVLTSAQVKQSILKTGDVEVGLKYGLITDQPIALSASLILGLPVGYNDNDALITGDSEFNQLIRLDASKDFSFVKSNAWLNVYSGFNHRSGDFTDELHYGIESGIDFSNDILAIVVRLQGIDALGVLKTNSHVNPQSLFSNNKEYLSVTPELTYHISSMWGITIGAGIPLKGKNIFADPSFSVGIFNHNKEYKPK
jgi:protein XagA